MQEYVAENVTVRYFSDFLQNNFPICCKKNKIDTHKNHYVQQQLINFEI